MTGIIRESVDDLAAQIPDGSKIVIAADYSGIAMELTRAMIRRGVRDLHVICLPVTGLQGEMLIGAGAVSTIETSGVTLGEFGGAPRFQAAIGEGSITIKDATCPAMHAALTAGMKGVPFMPIRGIIGSDILANRDDWLVQQNPFSAEEDPIVLLPAIVPDFAIFHAKKADRFGNVYIGIRREVVTMASAAKQSLVTVEEIVDGNLLENDETAAGTLPGLYVSGVAEAPRGCWPLGFWEEYAIDEAHMATYVKQARSAEGFADYVAEFVTGNAGGRATAAE